MSAAPGLLHKMDMKFFDSLFEGDSPNGAKLGMGLTGGDFWPRPGGCQNLYRGQSIATVDFTKVLSVADIAEEQLGPPSWIEHNPGATYFYVVRRANRCGDEEQTLGGVVKIAFDSGGNLSEPKCNSVFGATAWQMGGNKIELLWFYRPIEQEAAPDCFKVYWDNGSGQIDYQNAIVEVDYVGRRFYGWQSGPMSGEKYIFCIRALTKTGLEDGFLGQIKICLNTTQPEAVEILETAVV